MQYSPSPTEGPPTEGSDDVALISGLVAVVALTVAIALIVVIVILLVESKQGKVNGQINPFCTEGR